MNNSTRVAVSSTDSVVCIPYGAKGPLDRWKREYWTGSYCGKLSWLAVVIMIGFILVGPQFVLELTRFLPLEQLGNSGASIRAHQIVLLVAISLSIAPIILLTKALATPRSIELSDQGIRKCWLAGLKGKLTKWADVQQIKLKIPHGKTDNRTYRIEFIDRNTSSSSFFLSPYQLAEDTYKQSVLSFMEDHLPLNAIDSRVLDVLRPTKSLSFTDIWLQSMSTAPTGDRLVPLTAGVILDSRYRILKRQGANSANVYLADDLETVRQVLLREVPLPVYADGLRRKRALNELEKFANTLAPITHEGITKLIRTFVCDERAYLVLQHVDGQTLSDWVQRKETSSINECIEIAIKLCDIIAVLHNAELTPLNINPESIVIDARSQPVLIDFSVAVHREESTEPVPLKMAYVAPEQLKGKSESSSDIYGFGATVFYMLTGQHPDPLTESWPRLLNDEVPQELNDLIAKATKYNARERYKHASEMKQALVMLRSYVADKAAT